MRVSKGKIVETPTSATAGVTPPPSAVVVATWVLLVVVGFATGWIASRLYRGRPQKPPATDVMATEGTPKGESNPAMDAELLQFVGNPLPELNLEEIGARLDDPKWDDKASQEPVVSASDEVVPESQRWEIHFPSGVTEPEYARQLAALGVELGIVRDDGTMEYLANPGRPDPQRRTGQRKEENRLYWTWNRGNLDKADKSLLKGAGIDAGDDLILHLWPPATSEKLAKLEREFKGRDVKEIYRTRFALKRTFRGYEVHVEEQVTR
jgi:hypothetical protein